MRICKDVKMLGKSCLPDHRIVEYVNKQNVVVRWHWKLCALKYNVIFNIVDVSFLWYRPLYQAKTMQPYHGVFKFGFSTFTCKWLTTPRWS